MKKRWLNGGSIIITKLGDAPRLIANYGEGEWVKMRWVHTALDGSKIVVHWFRNLTTGQNVEYKFKSTQEVGNEGSVCVKLWRNAARELC